MSKAKSESRKNLTEQVRVSDIRGKFSEYKDTYLTPSSDIFNTSGLRQILKQFSFSSSMKLDDTP